MRETTPEGSPIKPFAFPAITTTLLAILIGSSRKPSSAGGREGLSSSPASSFLPLCLARCSRIYMECLRLGSFESAPLLTPRKTHSDLFGGLLGGLLLLLSRGQLCQQVGLVMPWCCSLARQMSMDPCWYQTASLAPCAAVSSRRIAMHLPLPARQRPHRSTMSITTASPPQIALLSRIAWTSSLAHGVDDLT